MSVAEKRSLTNSNLKQEEFIASRKEQKKAKRRKGLRAFLKNKKLVFGTVVLLVYIFVAIFAPMIAPYSYRELSTDILQKPSTAHLFGTDNFGRDVFSRVVYGSRISLSIAFSCTVIGTVVGVILGLISGYVGGWLDVITMRISDLVMSFPWVLMAVMVTAIFGVGLHVIVVTLGLIYIPGSIRLARSLALSIKSKEYVDAAKVIGESRWSIMFRYIFPNCFAPLLVQATLRLSSAVLSEAAISYMGYGTQPPSPSWGLLLSDAQQFIWQAPYLSIFPGLAMVLLVLAGNMFGDGLRDLIDPRMRGKVL